MFPSKSSNLFLEISIREIQAEMNFGRGCVLFGKARGSYRGSKSEIVCAIPYSISTYSRLVSFENSKTREKVRSMPQQLIATMVPSRRTVNLKLKNNISVFIRPSPNHPPKHHSHSSSSSKKRKIGEITMTLADSLG